ncbi:hypothetical protein MSAN_00973600 [Mycena sanguinolenta]|uniref:Uncharacterized protein n=1 Tax=Mycena sanguinolenta TaxID=230812 RepID=A0A8H6YXQ4_9AGAR|nr:hypothetical protein MSAN_00973600 [Mycena sanguinolenta]
MIVVQPALSTTRDNPYSSPFGSKASDRIPLRCGDDKHALLLGLVIVFRSPPSLDQISRVMDLSAEKVHIMLTPTLGSLASDPSSDIRLSKGLMCAILQTRDMELAAAHEKLACWCLKFLHMRHVRDIAYATQHWAYHVCRAEPTSHLLDTLRDIAFPLVTMSNQQLAAVVNWLKKSRTDGNSDVHDRIVQFESLLQAKPTDVESSVYAR